MLADILRAILTWLTIGVPIALLALWDALAAWRRGRRASAPESEPYDARADPRLARFWADVAASQAAPPVETWRTYHIVAVGRAPSLRSDSHGPARCRCAACRARRTRENA